MTETSSKRAEMQDINAPEHGAAQHGRPPNAMMLRMSKATCAEFANGTITGNSVDELIPAMLPPVAVGC